MINGNRRDQEQAYFAPEPSVFPNTLHFLWIRFNHIPQLNPWELLENDQLDAVVRNLRFHRYYSGSILSGGKLRKSAHYAVVPDWVAVKLPSCYCSEIKDFYPAGLKPCKEQILSTVDCSYWIVLSFGTKSATYPSVLQFDHCRAPEHCINCIVVVLIHRINQPNALILLNRRVRHL